MNDLLEYCLLGVALAMDCFSVSVAVGIGARKVIAVPMAAMALSFGLFQGGMTAIGHGAMSLFGSSLQEVDHWIAFALLLMLGLNMIREDMGDKSGEKSEGVPLLTLSGILAMSVATSIDALAVGVSLACSDDGGILVPALVIGFFSTLFSVAGLGIGITLGKTRRWKAGTVGGVVLVLIGVKILLEHVM